MSNIEKRKLFDFFFLANLLFTLRLLKLSKDLTWNVYLFFWLPIKLLPVLKKEINGWQKSNVGYMDSWFKLIFVSFLVLHVFEERYFARNSLKMIQSKMHINLKDNFFYAVNSQSLRLHLKLSTTLLTLRQILFSFNWMNFTAILYFSKRKWWHHYGENVVCEIHWQLKFSEWKTILTRFHTAEDTYKSVKRFIDSNLFRVPIQFYKIIQIVRALWLAI